MGESRTTKGITYTGKLTNGIHRTHTQSGITTNTFGEDPIRDNRMRHIIVELENSLDRGVIS